MLVAMALSWHLAVSEAKAQQGQRQPAELVIVEYAPMVSEISGVDVSGHMDIEADENSCRRLTMRYRLVLNYQMNTEIGVFSFPPEVGDRIFVQGVTYSFTRRSCLPDSDAKVLIEDSLSFKVPSGSTANIALSYNPSTYRISKGVVELSGTVVLITADEASVFEVTPQPSEPLVLTLAKEGFKHKSGTGTVVAPKGNVYRFAVGK